MYADKTESIYKQESQQIIGCAIAVLNTIGNGFHEKPYENALVVEFNLRNIPYVQQKLFDLTYKSQKVGEFIPDIIVFDKIIVDTKRIDKITDTEIGQMMNYLKITNLKLGYIINLNTLILSGE